MPVTPKPTGALTPAGASSPGKSRLDCPYFGECRYDGPQSGCRPRPSGNRQPRHFVCINEPGMRAAPATPPAAPPIEGSPDPLEGFFARHQAELLGTLYYLLGNLEDARDALQETFVKCWRHRETAAGVDNLRAWVFRVALNTGRDLRGTAWRRRRRPLAEDDALPPARDSEPAGDLARREQFERLHLAVLALRPEEQEVFLLRQNGELKYEEIAAAAGIPLGTVKTRMRLALEKLRVALAEQD